MLGFDNVLGILREIAKAGLGWCQITPGTYVESIIGCTTKHAGTLVAFEALNSPSRRAWRCRYTDLNIATGRSISGK
jgi:hypothetical protein